MLTRKIKRLCLITAVCGLLAPPVLAQSMRADRPDEYTVQRGDTLWDISARFLHEPWLWPEIWQANPQIENPHLIYPGDTVALVLDGGKPRLRVTRDGRPVVRMSPSVRVVRRGREAIPTIPIDAIFQFLSRPRVVEEGYLEQAPYVLSVGKEHLVAGGGSRVYARGNGLEQARRFALVRQGGAYVDPATDEILGYEALHLGDAVIEREGDPATVRLLQTHREVLAGDRLLPVEDGRFEENFSPRAPERTVSGTIIDVVDGVTQIGQYQVVVLNVGESNGVAPGHVLSVWQKGEVVVDPMRRDSIADLPAPASLIEDDPERQGGLDGFTIAADRVLREIQRSVTSVFDDGTELVALPEERAGTIMVFRTYDRVSYALVMDATRAMHVHDSVKNP
jgi:hypothetical protein